MHTYFGEWYRAAGIPTETIPLAKRWEAIEAFDVNADAVTLLTQIFYGLGLSDAAFPETFRTAFNSADPNFQMSGNDRELLVLAGAALVNTMDKRARNLADLAGLCVICASVQNVRATPAVAQIPELAAKYLSTRSANRAKPEQDSAASDLAAALTAAGEPYDALAPEFEKLQLQFPIIAEESNMLWWSFGETSRDLDERWGTMPLEAVCLVGPKELADLTRAIPGPVAARAFLDRAIRSGRNSVKASVSITDVVNDTPKPWREANFTKSLPNELKRILPINEAVRLSVEAAGDNNAWRSLFKTSTGISAAAKAAPDKLAYQVFLEHLAIRRFAAMKTP